MAQTLSTRGQALVNQPLRDDFELFHDAEQRAFHPVERPEGAISLCIAENVLSWPDMRERLQRAAAQTAPEWVAKYTDVRGAPEFRAALAGFAERHITTLGQKALRPLDPEGFCVASGATAVIELTSMLLGDNSDVAAFPAPCYPVYKQDIGHKAKLQRYDVECAAGWTDTQGQHPLHLDDLNRCLRAIRSEGKTLRMLVLTQPDNPTGAIYSQDQLETFADWAERNEVHLCVNELYALSQFDTEDARLAGDYPPAPVPYTSFLHLIEQRRSSYLHWWYSFSKDFGISGLRCGVLYTRNESLVQAFGNFGAPHTVSNHTQWLLTQVISDGEWVTAFAKTNQARLTASYAAVIEAFRQNDIQFVPARGSLFVWARLNLDPATTDEVFWRKLYEDTGVLLTSPGGFGYEESGWLRMVYSCVTRPVLEEALRRLV